MTLPASLSWRTARAELAALAAVALALPLRFLFRVEPFDPEAPHPTPVVFVHGFLGDLTNFLVLRNFLAARGIRNFSSFSYRPRINPQPLAFRLARTLEAVCTATGAKQVDVIGHSLGGLVARSLIEIGEGHRVRRLVTLGAPYYTNRVPEQELAIFAANDALVPAPHPIYRPHGRTRVVPECGHLGLLYHPTALREVARYLTRPVKSAAAPWLPSRAAA